MENEIENFIKVWIIAIVSICYCYYIATHISKGLQRLISILPIIFLFFLLPLPLSTFHLCGVTAFYLVWLGNSKILLFAFGLGPLAEPKSLVHFISISLLPIQFVSEKTRNNSAPSIRRYAAMALALALVIYAYTYREIWPDYVKYILYCFNVYLSGELVLGVSRALVLIVFGFHLEPQFNEPYLATSLQDFWGRRWNLMVPSILRQTVYIPTVEYGSKLLNRMWAQALAMFASFLVSGLMHELIYYYVTRVRPTWEVTWFFVLQGVSTAAEVMAKKAMKGKWTFPVVISRLLTLGYVMGTAVWLFFPQLVRYGTDEKIIGEYYAMADYVREKLSFSFLFGRF